MLYIEKMQAEIFTERERDRRRIIETSIKIAQRPRTKEYSKITFFSPPIYATIC